jgi:hypothetical protein
VTSTILATIDLVVHCRMDVDGQRHVAEIARPIAVGSSGSLTMESLWDWQ